MVRVVRTAVMPMSGGTIRTLTREHIKGRGNAVLLNKGGPGAGSSYSSLDDYISTTGINPLAGPAPQVSAGRGFSAGRSLESMNHKLENLLVKSKRHSAKKEKNINFNI